MNSAISGHDPLPTIQNNQHEPQRETASILPLPAEVIAQINSSATITCLTTVVLGLVENSLDADASKVTVDVDFGRGGCFVEDDGLGILPQEFREDGGLGKLYHTSKYSISDSTYGQDGLFLASLSALCLLNITSHHQFHRSINSVAFHHSKVVSRHVPAPNSHFINCRDHGTKVSVRNLFGNMPVRVKQRALALEGRGEKERQWDGLIYGLVALMTASGRVVSLRVKDIATSKTLALLESKSQPAGSNQIGPSQPGRLRVALSILSQAGLISPNETSSWVPASASSRSIVIKGAISLQPVPTKTIQFLSFGIHPLPRTAHNELYDHINRLFAKSQFGVVQEESVTEEEKRRRLTDKRFKQNGLTYKQKLFEKAVDRWPMFTLNISRKEKGARSTAGEISRSGATLKAVIDVLDALITSWLNSHYFSSHGRKPKKKDVSDGLAGEALDSEIGSQGELSSNEPSRPSSASIIIAKTRKRERDNSPRRPYTGIATFNELSRIKSAKGGLMDSDRQSDFKINHRPIAPDRETSTTSPVVRVESLLPGQLSAPLRPKPRHISLTKNINDAESIVGIPTPPESKSTSAHVEMTVDWMDPITKEIQKVNARTGTAIVPVHTRDTAMNDGRSCDVLQRRVSLQMVKRRPSGETESKSWLGDILQKWNNPIFHTNEKSIPQVSLEIPAPGESSGSFRTRTTDKSFTEISKTNASRLSKSALKKAQVIAQVDKKFILVTMAASSDENTGSSHENTMLVAIDQHAADERCKVEDLFKNLCAKPRETDNVPGSALAHKTAVQASILSPPLIFKIQAREGELFKFYAARFADWAIVYTFEPAGTENDLPGGTHLMVQTLPCVIAERCKLEPKILITLLRTELWKLAEANTTNTSLKEKKEIFPKHSWLQRIGNCPEGILDMVNSRACRSAIMFNDTLSLQECKDLVHKLASCAFPFQCAHGRPSMVPLIALGEQNGISADPGHYLGLGNTALGKETALEFFGEAFVKWQLEKVGGDI